MSFFRKEEPSSPKIGFGNDSIKIPGITVTTIRRNLREAKKLVPTVKESEARVRERVQKDADRAHAEADDKVASTLDFRSGQSRAIAETRQFVNALNEDVGRALERLGKIPAQQHNRLDVRIGNIAVPFDSPPARPPLDLLA